MSDTIEQTEKLYVEARAAVQAVTLDLSATQDQIDAAKAARERMFQAHANAILDDIAGRTALLQSLLAELEAIRATTQVNPIGEALGKINEVAGLIEGAIAEAGGDGN
jgi:signal recognition particle GTPase